VTTKHVIALVFVIAGCSVVGLAPLAALTFRTTLERLHFVSPITSVGVPLVAIGVGIDEGPDLTTGLVLVTAALLAFAGPVLSAAAARATVPDGELLGGRSSE
jgi:multisubunit Na+/H+ antiporter MnhG subunit